MHVGRRFFSKCKVFNLLPRVAHVLETFVFLDFISREIFVAVVVGDACGEDGDVPQPWEVLLLLLYLNVDTTLSAALNSTTAALCGKVEEVAGKQVALLCKVVTDKTVSLITFDREGSAEQCEEEPESRPGHLSRWHLAADWAARWLIGSIVARPSGGQLLNSELQLEPLSHLTYTLPATLPSGVSEYSGLTAACGASAVPLDMHNVEPRSGRQSRLQIGFTAVETYFHNTARFLCVNYHTFD